jgi:FkbM family methyltransferase
MKRGFLDGGARHLEGLKHCVGELGIDASWEVISYEPTPESYAIAQQERGALPFAVDLRNAALWREAGAIQLWTEAEDVTGYGNTVMMAPGRSVDGRDMRPTHLVVADDVSAVLGEFARLGCTEIHVKLDIEGAEFEVLPRLLASPYAPLVRTVRIEWHERFFVAELEAYQRRRQELTEALGRRSIQVIDHW